ncbi:MAG TPA: hypothetical protein VM163_04950 [bacterium]|nr:hypothetical protein [bacterium]
MFKTSVWCAIGVALLVLMGCVKPVVVQRGQDERSQPSFSTEELEDRLEHFNQSRNSIKTFAMSLTMSISRTNERVLFSKCFRCEAVCDVPDKLRMKGYAGGTVPAFDLLTKSRKVQLYLPTRNELIRGTRSRFKELTIAQKHGISEVLEADLADLFVQKLPSKDVFWEATSDGIWLYSDASHGQSWQRTLLDFETLLPVRQEVFSQTGQMLLEVQFADYRRVEQTYCPFELNIRSKIDGFIIKIVIGSVRANIPIAGGAFSIQVPDSVTKIPPSQVETTIQESPDSP